MVRSASSSPPLVHTDFCQVTALIAGGADPKLKTVRSLALAASLRHSPRLIPRCHLLRSRTSQSVVCTKSLHPITLYSCPRRTYDTYPQSTHSPHVCPSSLRSIQRVRSCQIYTHSLLIEGRAALRGGEGLRGRRPGADESRRERGGADLARCALSQSAGRQGACQADRQDEDIALSSAVRRMRCLSIFFRSCLVLIRASGSFSCTQS